MAIGVDLGQIVKSLVFAVDGEAVVALVSGDNLLDEEKLATCAGGDTAWREDADTVRDATGYPVGGVPPFGYREPLRIFIDEDLLEYEELWAAASTSTKSFGLRPARRTPTSPSPRTSSCGQPAERSATSPGGASWTAFAVARGLGFPTR
jgi:prolyl-tRNA editing enzyme YbaK/EbsC (Cys-tRNA(Pro) deacylase)